MIQHILPINDLKIHIENSTCHCSPEVQLLDNGYLLVIHNAYDGRK